MFLYQLRRYINIQIHVQTKDLLVQRRSYYGATSIPIYLTLPFDGAVPSTRTTRKSVLEIKKHAVVLIKLIRLICGIFFLW